VLRGRLGEVRLPEGVHLPVLGVQVLPEEPLKKSLTQPQKAATLVA
jgi:hypothetical protein